MAEKKNLYLKYRPIQLGDVVGQKSIMETLKQATLKNQFSHAYLFSGNHGCGKCIEGDSLVLLKSGIKKIKNIVNNNKDKKISPINITVKDETEYGNSYHGYFEANAKTLNITTKHGYSLEGTPEHPIRILDKNGEIRWRKLSDIRVGDYCAIFRNSSNDDQIGGKEETIEFKFDTSNSAAKVFKVPTTFNTELSRLCGYFVAEGCFGSSKSISISNTDKNIIEDIKNILKKQFNYDAKISFDKRNEVKIIYINSVYICRFLDGIGLNEKSYTKHIPDIILSSPKYIIREFLRAYFEGDGYVENNRKSIGCCSMSKTLLHQIHVLLLEFGIVSTLRKRKSKCNNKTFVSWVISICSNNAKLFAEKIGFISSRKIKESIGIQRNITNNTNIDIIPFLKGKVCGIRKLLPITANGFVRVNGKCISRSPRWNSHFSPIDKGNNINLTYNNLMPILNYFTFFLPYISRKQHYNKVNNLIKGIKQIVALNYFYSPVKSIVKGKCDVYDICKDGNDKSFIANGFINHNTSSARILATLMTCENIKDGVICGECRACKGIHVGASLDVKEIDGATKRKIEDIRDLIDGASWSPNELKRKVYIIDEAHQLTKEATSALLKILEEPPPYLNFILCTTEIKKILPTILSRCQRFNFTKIASTDITDRLKLISQKENINIEEEGLGIMAKMARGSMRDAIGYLDQVATVAANKRISAKGINTYFGMVDRKAILSILKAVISGNIPVVLDQVNDMIMASADINSILFEISEAFRNAMVLKAQSGNRKLIDLPDYEIDELKKISEEMQMKQLLKLAKLFSDVEKKISFNINERWIMEATLINCVAILRQQ